MGNTRQSKKNHDEVQNMFKALHEVGQDINDTGYDFAYFLFETKHGEMTVSAHASTISMLWGIAAIIHQMNVDDEIVLESLKSKLEVLNEG